MIQNTIAVSPTFPTACIVVLEKATVFVSQFPVSCLDFCVVCMQLRGSCCCDEPSLYKDNKAARKSLLVDGLISSSRSLSVKMMTLRVQILSLVSVFFVLQTNPSYAVPINVDEDFLKPLCENPPPVLRLVCKSLFGVTCPTQAKLGDWAYNGREVDGSLNSTAASACPGVRLQTYERTTNLSTILSECHSKVIVQTEEEYRCEY